MSKTVIISGGMLDEGFAEKVLEANPEAYIIAVDKGLEYLYNHKIFATGRTYIQIIF